MKRGSIVVPTLVRLESIGETIESVTSSDFDDVELDVSISVNSRYTDRFEPLAKRNYPLSLGVFFEPTTRKTHAADEKIRFKGSSGSALSVLSLYCLEVEKMAGVRLDDKAAPHESSSTTNWNPLSDQRRHPSGA